MGHSYPVQVQGLLVHIHPITRIAGAEARSFIVAAREMAEINLDVSYRHRLLKSLPRRRPADISFSAHLGNPLRDLDHKLQTWVTSLQRASVFPRMRPQVEEVIF